VETRGGARHQGAGACGDLHQDAGQRPQILQEVRRPPDGQPSAARAGRRLSATIPTLAFAPAVHVNYAETVLPMRDGLPKLKDFPSEFGGSGELVSD
jgi:hypothetical protein